MGAVLVWLAQHAKQLAAWAAFVAAIGVLLLAVGNSGVYDSVSEGFASAKSAISEKLTAAANTINSAADSVETLVSRDTTGWTETIFYTLSVDVLVSAFVFLGVSFGAVASFLLAGMGASAAIGVACWAYVRAVSLARALSTGQISLGK